MEANRDRDVAQEPVRVVGEPDETRRAIDHDSDAGSRLEALPRRLRHRPAERRNRDDQAGLPQSRVGQ